MKILAIDSSAKAASAAIADDEKIIGEFFVNNALTHSQTLIPMVEQVFSVTGMSIKDIDVVAVNTGPGSFTGVRIGVAAAKGLAFANDVPCVSVSTLNSMAYNMLGSSCIVCAVMDARCSQVYTAMFKVNGNSVERLSDDKAMSMHDLKLELENIRKDENIVLVGDGAEITYEFLNNQLKNVTLAPINHIMQTASSVALAGAELYKANKTLSCEALMPVYLRLPQAQRELNKKMGVQK